MSSAGPWPTARGQAEQPAGPGDEVALDLGEPECRASGGDDDVGGEGDLAAAGSCQAVDGGDHRLASLAVGEAGEATASGDQGRHVAGADLLEVGSGAEHRPLLSGGVGGEDADPQVGIVFEAIDRRLESAGHVTVDGVARLRSVQRDDRDVAVDLAA